MYKIPTLISYFFHRLKEQKIIISNTGPEKNVMTILAPMCFTCDNARRVVQAFDMALMDIEKGASTGITETAKEDSKFSVPLNILSTDLLDSSDSDDEGPEAKRPKWEGVD